MQNKNNECVDILSDKLFTHCLITPVSYMHTHRYVSVRILPEDTLV